MGKRGPNPKPTKLKVLNGNSGKHKLNENEPMPEEVNDVPDPPWYLDYYAKKEWKRSAPHLIKVGLLTEADLTMFQEYCEMHGHCVRLHQKIREDGYEFLTGEDNHYHQRMPITSILKDFLKAKTNLAEQLGLTPSARTNIEVDSGEEGPSVEDILNGEAK